MNPPLPPPRVTIALPVRLATGTIERTIASLLGQSHDSFEVVAAVHPLDPTAPVLRGERRVRLLESTEPAAGVPQLRRDAVMAARGELLALAEDHCEYPRDWLATLETALGDKSVSVAGGAVANGRRSYAGWAQYFTRYAAFLPPRRAGLTSHLPGNNACYRTEELLERRDRLADGFWEAEFNDSLRSEGLHLTMTGAVATQRQERGGLDYFALRYRHGRCYGGRRMASAEEGERRRLWRRAPLIPAVLLARTARTSLRSPEAGAFALTSPLVFGYQLAWAVGEIAGYAAGPGNTAARTD